MIANLENQLRLASISQNNRDTPVIAVARTDGNLDEKDVLSKSSSSHTDSSSSIGERKFRKSWKEVPNKQTSLALVNQAYQAEQYNQVSAADFWKEKDDSFYKEDELFEESKRSTERNEYFEEAKESPQDYKVQKFSSSKASMS